MGEGDGAVGRTSVAICWRSSGGSWSRLMAPVGPGAGCSYWKGDVGAVQGVFVSTFLAIETGGWSWSCVAWGAAVCHCPPADHRGTPPATPPPRHLQGAIL